MENQVLTLHQEATVLRSPRTSTFSIQLLIKEHWRLFNLLAGWLLKRLYWAVLPIVNDFFHKLLNHHVKYHTAFVQNVPPWEIVALVFEHHLLSLFLLQFYQVFPSFLNLFYFESSMLVISMVNMMLMIFSLFMFLIFMFARFCFLQKEIRDLLVNLKNRFFHVSRLINYLLNSSWAGYALVTEIRKVFLISWEKADRSWTFIRRRAWTFSISIRGGVAIYHFLNR